MKKRRNKKRQTATTTVTSLIALLAVVLVIFVIKSEVEASPDPTSPVPSTGTTAPVTTTKAPEAEKKTVTIGSAGDVLIHVPLYENARKSDGSYNFDHVFTYSKALMSECDYFVANLETTLAGTDGRSYAGYPCFNSPDAIAYSLKKAGADCLLTANNHSYDTRGHGVARTIDVVEKAGLEHTGTGKTEDYAKYFVKDFDGVTLGFACYTYETPTSEGRKALNGILVDTETAELINSFKPEEPEDFYDEVSLSLAGMKQQGADYTVIYIHWGEEYQLKQNSNQESLAQGLCDLGVDIIIGGHPHVVQPMELLTSTDGSHKTVCVYSLGNFVSNQRRSYMGLKTGHTEDGLIFTMTFSAHSDGTVTFDKVSAIPTWVHLFSENGKKVHAITPLEKGFEKNASKLGLYKTGDGLSQAKASYERTRDLVSEGEKQCNDYLRSLQNK